MSIRLWWLYVFAFLISLILVGTIGSITYSAISNRRALTECVLDKVIKHEYPSFFTPGLKKECVHVLIEPGQCVVFEGSIYGFSK